jgi:hypothetical protein
MIGTFTVDYEEETDSTVLFTSHDDRNISIYIKNIYGDVVTPDPEGGGDYRNVVGYETTIEYGVEVASITRYHSHGDPTDFLTERVVDNATVEDVIAALQWVIGKVIGKVTK